MKRASIFENVLGMTFCLSLGMASGYAAHSGVSDWYDMLIKFPLNPPSWIFAPVWTVLYLMLGVVLANFWVNRRLYSNLLVIFSLNLIMNFLWSELFFGMHRIDLAFYDLIGIWLSALVILAILKRREDRFLLWMIAPYCMWVSFALLLNFYIFINN